MNTIKELLQKVSSIGFWGVLFRWRKIKSLIVEGLFELQKIIETGEEYKKELERVWQEYNQATNKLEATEERVNDLQTDKSMQSLEICTLRDHIRVLDSRISDLQKMDEVRYIDQQKSMQTLSELKEQLVQERWLEKEAVQREQEEHMERQRTTWQIGRAHV